MTTTAPPERSSDRGPRDHFGIDDFHRVSRMVDVRQWGCCPTTHSTVGGKPHFGLSFSIQRQHDCATVATATPT